MRDAGLEGSRNGGMQTKDAGQGDAGQEGCRTEGMPDRTDVEQGRSRTRKNFTVTNLLKKRCYFDGVSFSLASFTFLNTVSFYICCSVKNV